MPLRFTMLLVLTKAFLRSPRRARRVVARAATNGGEWALPSGWRAALGDELASDRFRDLQAFVAAERAPKPSTRRRTRRSALRSVDLGGVRASWGRTRTTAPARPTASPSASPAAAPSPSLRNVLRECAEDHGAAPAAATSRLGDQGVLLLNTALTVREGEAHSHRGRGWERLTDAVVAALAAAGATGRLRALGQPSEEAAIVGGGTASGEAPRSAPLAEAVARETPRSAPLAAAAHDEAPRSARFAAARDDGGLLGAVFLDADEPDDDRGAGPLCGWRTFDDQLAALEAFRRKGGARGPRLPGVRRPQRAAARV
ncbi:hypothetical protein JL720_16158 [Aureococcus anophagefferens]|nr:hypothetical protein JL720_16158 [Aureococcus anophagefferens]